jgi:parallel beta-helix repeat protein
MANSTNNVRKRTFVGIGLFLLFSMTLITAISVHPVQASSTIYIRADGSIEPLTANITRDEFNITYTFTDNNYDSIVIERDNITLDGAGFTLEALSGDGIDISGRSNVTIKNMTIYRCGQQASWVNGIRLDYSYNNTIFNVSIINTRGVGINLEYSSGNSIHHNLFENNYLTLYQTTGNMIYNNTFVNTLIELKGDRYIVEFSINHYAFHPIFRNDVSMHLIVFSVDVDFTFSKIVVVYAVTVSFEFY